MKFAVFDLSILKIFLIYSHSLEVSASLLVQNVCIKSM